MTLQEDWRQRREGRKAAHLHSAHLVLMYSFAFIFFVVFQASWKVLQKTPTSKANQKVRVQWWCIYGFFFLFFFSEISCWGNKTPCNFQQWKVNQFFCLKKTPKPHFHISIFNFCTCMYISVIFQPHVAICLCSEGFFFLFFFDCGLCEAWLACKRSTGKKILQSSLN